jgi:DNA-binding NtrC family response regulator
MTATQMETITDCEPQRILVVDDDFAVRLSLQILLRKHGYEVWTAEDALSAYQDIDRIKPQLIILDIRLPAIDGIDFLHILQNKKVNAKVIFISAYNDMDFDKAFYMGAYDYIKKPFQADEIINAVSKALNC